MDSATALLHALSGEEGRWTGQSKEFDSQIMRLTGGRLLLPSPLVGLPREACL
jgi:dynein heavy chain